jgi:hypothetical protein
MVNIKPLIVFVVLIVSFFLVWLIFFRKNASLTEFIKKLFDLILLPFKLLLKLFGVEIGKKGVEPPVGAKEEPPEKGVEPPVGAKEEPPEIKVVHDKQTTCPPCEVKCPDAPAPTDCKPFELEIKYLKDMVKFVGAMAKRENAINAQYRELYPGFSVMSPEVRRLSYEYNFLKNEMREDENKWTYFKNYFTKLSGIPSTSSAIHYDLTM